MRNMLVARPCRAESTGSNKKVCDVRGRSDRDEKASTSLFVLPFSQWWHSTVTYTCICSIIWQLVAEIHSFRTRKRLTSMLISFLLLTASILSLIAPSSEIIGAHAHALMHACHRPIDRMMSGHVRRMDLKPNERLANSR